ncbi:nucleoside triphosphate pyrophosphohydrolase family protein [Undibacterium sp. Di26W]|uniref:nucleoside triphosphate pyrophosphohydrolase family protein n=1 Tax=Undibacterium sp. Di26W TaxID=3413035 RepID=UPI003BF0B723
MTKITRKRARSPLTLREYQKAVDKTDEKKRAIISLLGLVGEIGDLQSIVKKALLRNTHPTFKQEISEEIGDILWYVSSLASCYKLSLEEIANENLKKAHQLFDQGSITIFDADYPADERFPRQFSVTFSEKTVDSSIKVKIAINSVFVGDDLDDNAHEDDGYRYHDIFHLAYAAVLGWSPVVRKLLRIKRKSNASTDRIEDGARAIFLEEAISVFVFNQADARNYYHEKNSIDFGLLKTIKKLSETLEVKRCTIKQWQEAIYQGYMVFRMLKKNKGGTVALDLDKATISFQSTSAIQNHE